MCLEMKDLLGEANLELVEFYDITQTKKKVVLDYNFGCNSDFKFHMDQEYFVSLVDSESNTYEVCTDHSNIGFISIDKDNSIYIMDKDKINLAINFGSFIDSVFHLVYLGG